jgi:hypothetical protein
MTDFPSFALTEHDANEFAKAWTPSEKVAIARAIEEELKAKAKERQGQRTDLNPDIPNNCSESELGQESAHIAAEKAGFGSHMTYRRAKRVVDKGVPELAEAMDAGWREKAKAPPDGEAIRRYAGLQSPVRNGLRRGLEPDAVAERGQRNYR